jgi:type III pantothenate kinase
VANNILCIDAGNSAIKWALSSRSGLSEMMSLAYEDDFSSDILFAVWKPLEQPSHIIASCVASEAIWLAITEACNERWNIDVQRVSSLKQGHGLINAYEIPSDLGSDRWSAMVGAHHEVQSAFMIVDAGSAITIDLVSESGQHIGGYISPGIKMMKQSLGLNTAQVNIESDKNETTSLLPASSTVECVSAGIYLSAVKLIEAVFEQESKKIKELTAIVTGGNAKRIADLLSFKYVTMPDLVLRGLVEIQKNNQE